jgi:putative transposase
VLWWCRTLYNATLEQRITTWTRRHASVTRYQQEAELKAIRADLPEYAAIHSHILQGALARLDRTYQAFFRRVAHGEQPGFPRFQARNRWPSFTYLVHLPRSPTSFTYKEYGNGARLDTGSLVLSGPLDDRVLSTIGSSRRSGPLDDRVLSTIGRIAVRWSRPVEGTIKTVTVSKEADGWYGCCSCAEVPTHPLPFTGRETGLDVGLRVFLSTADGDAVANPRHHRKAERELKKAQRRVSRRKKEGHRRQQAAVQCAKKHQHGSTSTCADSGSTSTTRRRSPSCAGTTRFTWRPYNSPT